MGIELSWAAVVAGLLYILATPAWAAEPGGAKLFELRCGKCHTVEKLAPGLAKQPLPEREARLERFLARHHAKDDAERRAIIAYLSVPSR